MDRYIYNLKLKNGVLQASQIPKAFVGPTKWSMCDFCS